MNNCGIKMFLTNELSLQIYLGQQNIASRNYAVLNNEYVAAGFVDSILTTYTLNIPRRQLIKRINIHFRLRNELENCSKYLCAIPTSWSLTQTGSEK